MRLMFWYAVAPVVIVFGTLVFLTMPYLALAVLVIVAFGALAALAWAIVALPYMLGRAISDRWRSRGRARARTAAGPAPAWDRKTSRIQAASREP